MLSIIKFTLHGIERQMISGVNPNEISNDLLLETIMEEWNCKKEDIEIVSINVVLAI